MSVVLSSKKKCPYKELTSRGINNFKDYVWREKETSKYNSNDSGNYQSLQSQVQAF